MTGLAAAVCGVHALLPDRGNGVTGIAPRRTAATPLRGASEPDHGITIGGWFRRQEPDDAAALLDAAATGAVRLHEHLRRHAERSLRIAVRA